MVFKQLNGTVYETGIMTSVILAVHELNIITITKIRRPG